MSEAIKVLEEKVRELDERNKRVTSDRNKVDEELRDMDRKHNASRQVLKDRLDNADRKVAEAMQKRAELMAAIARLNGGGGGPPGGGGNPNN